MFSTKQDSHMIGCGKRKDMKESQGQDMRSR